MGSRSATPASTVAILIGASSFPFSSLDPAPAFSHSASGIRKYLLDKDTGFGLTPKNLLDLFDSDYSPSKTARTIQAFLKLRITIAKDVLVFYVGHGGFVGPNSDYYLALRTTTDGNPGVSSLRIADLARTLIEGARHLRRYIVLDSCFAASAYKEFMAAPLEVARVKTLDAFPDKGTALLCSSGPRDPSKAPPGQKLTMFTDALLSVLHEGDDQFGDRLPLYHVGRRVRDYIIKKHQSEGVRPEVHSPDQRQGDVADFPLFPNPASRSMRIGTPEAPKDFLRGSRTIKIWISQLFRISDLLIFPESVRAKKLFEVFGDPDKMRRALNHHAKFRLGDLGTVTPVRFDDFWGLGLHSFRGPGAPPLWFLPFELSLSEKLASHRYDLRSLMGGILAESNTMLSNEQISGRLRIYPPGVGVVRIGITLSFKEAVHVPSVAKISRDVEQLLFMDPSGASKPYKEILLEIVDQVENALFLAPFKSNEDRSWRPPETIYILRDDAGGLSPERHVEELANMMSLAPRNQEDRQLLESRIQDRLNSPHWQRDQIFSVVGEGISLLFLAAQHTPSKDRARDACLYWLQETAELVSAAAYTEKAFLEEIEKITEPRLLDRSWLPNEGEQFAYLYNVLHSMKRALQAAFSIKAHIERRGAGVLMVFANDIWKFNNPVSVSALAEALAYIREWLTGSAQQIDEPRLEELAQSVATIGQISSPFRVRSS